MRRLDINKISANEFHNTTRRTSNNAEKPIILHLESPIKAKGEYHFLMRTPLFSLTPEEIKYRLFKIIDLCIDNNISIDGLEEYDLGNLYEILEERLLKKFAISEYTSIIFNKEYKPYIRHQFNDKRKEVYQKWDDIRFYESITCELNLFYIDKFQFKSEEVKLIFHKWIYLMQNKNIFPSDVNIFSSDFPSWFFTVEKDKKGKVKSDYIDYLEEIIHDDPDELEQRQHQIKTLKNYYKYKNNYPKVSEDDLLSEIKSLIKTNISLPEKKFLNKLLVYIPKARIVFNRAKLIYDDVTDLTYGSIVFVRDNDVFLKEYCDNLELYFNEGSGTVDYYFMYGTDMKQRNKIYNQYKPDILLYDIINFLQKYFYGH